MTTVIEPTAFQRARESILAAVDAGAALEDLEHSLDHLMLPSDSRDALWLVAWAAIERRDRRAARVAPAVLRHLRAG